MKRTEKVEIRVSLEEKQTPHATCQTRRRKRERIDTRARRKIHCPEHGEHNPPVSKMANRGGLIDGRLCWPRIDINSDVFALILTGQDNAAKGQFRSRLSFRWQIH